MLSATQIEILRQLDELSASSLTPNDQHPFVAAIIELIQQLDDAAEYELLIAPTLRESPLKTFVQLSRRRLVAAQAKSAQNYARKRELRTQIVISDPEDGTEAEKRTGSAADLTSAGLAESLQVAKSDDINQVLQRMHDMAQQEVFKSELNISELDMSSRTLRELQEKYSGVDLLLNASNQLVKVINEADAWERRYMMASLGFLALVMCYIVYRRILSGPIKLLLWGFLNLVGATKLIFDTVAPDSLSENASLSVASPISVVASATALLTTTALASTTLTPSPIEAPVQPRVGGVRQNISFVPKEVTSASVVHSEL